MIIVELNRPTFSASIFRIFVFSLSRSHCVFRTCTSSATIFVTRSMFSLCTFISLIFSSPTKTNQLTLSTSYIIYCKITGYIFHLFVEKPFLLPAAWSAVLPVLALRILEAARNEVPFAIVQFHYSVLETNARFKNQLLFC